MVHIEKLESYAIPMYGNKRTLPYGNLIVIDDTLIKKVVDIKETKDGDQYFIFNRHRYYVRNVGTLYLPRFEILN